MARSDFGKGLDDLDAASKRAKEIDDRLKKGRTRRILDGAKPVLVINGEEKPRTIEIPDSREICGND